MGFGLLEGGCGGFLEGGDGGEADPRVGGGDGFDEVWGPDEPAYAPSLDFACQHASFTSWPLATR